MSKIGKKIHSIGKALTSLLKLFNGSGKL